MGQSALAERLEFNITDVTGQRHYHVSNARRDASVGEIVKMHLPQLGLSPRDPDGEPVTYRMRLEREGRNLFHSERIGDVIKKDDEVTLERYVQAGGR